MKILGIVFILFSASAFALPVRYTELLDFVQEAPDQADSATCLFVSSTGAMELIANKKEGIRNPRPGDKFDLAEPFLIQAPTYNSKGKYFWEIPLHKFNKGNFGIHISDWAFEPWDGTDTSDNPWSYRDWSAMPKVKLPEIETIPLFVIGTKWSTNVLKESHVQLIKESLVKYQAPVLINYNDTGYWHVILIVGYDDEVPGRCHELTAEQCGEQKGAFYVRDSFGVPVELRDYDWYRIKGNAAFVVKEKK
jgi:hypothetical protein